MSHSFRFEGLEVWQRGAEVALTMFEIADRLEANKRFRFAEQLRGASLSITNNIAEGSGSRSKNEFRQFLNIARRSVFECANMLLLFTRARLASQQAVQPILEELDQISRMITAFAKSLGQ